MADIRHATLSDAVGINRIGNHYILNTPANFKLNALTIGERGDWIRSFGLSGRYQLLVAIENDQVKGYAGSTQFHERGAYLTSVAVMIYLDPVACGKGLGSLLYQQLFQCLQKEDIHRAFAGITVPNPPSEALHRKFAFRETGTFTEAGRKFGKYWDVLWMEKHM